MTYSIADQNHIIIDHTEVEPEFKGKSVGKQLLYKFWKLCDKKYKNYTFMSISKRNVQ